MNNMRVYNDIRMITLPKLEDLQYYIYAIENEVGYVKIGISKDVSQRISSLSGSNGGGNKIIRVAISNPTYLKTLEGSFHTIFSRYRINGTEWFKGITFDEILTKMNETFNSDSYFRCNEMRKQAGGYNSRK
ncbi:MAG: GIY-YIG nuclease family protein [Bacilli bacterium]|nr:GIY-YIG nuclease family protein [Bacilli bacterium]